MKGYNNKKVILNSVYVYELQMVTLNIHVINCFK